MASLKTFLSVLVLFAFASAAVASRSVIRMFPGKSPMRLDGHVDQTCESWKFSFETNNLRNLTIPKECVEFVKKYIIDSDGNSRYLDDLLYTVNTANEFAKNVNLDSDGKDAWIFGVDETMLSNLLYYAENGFGSESFNETAFDKWVEKANAPPIFYTLFFYKQLQILGFKIIILTGRDEPARNSTELNLRKNAYYNWEKLIMRGTEDQGKTSIAYKSEKIAELVQEGYRLHGNIGDQWSDLLASSVPTRSFKLPNPLYYVP